MFFPERRRNEGRETETAARQRKFIPLLLTGAASGRPFLLDKIYSRRPVKSI
jgi:hypothetical protein